jgi:DNA polymerase-3 subunit delta'
MAQDHFPWHDSVIDDLLLHASSGTLPTSIALICAEGWGGFELIQRAALSLLNITSTQPVNEIAHPDFFWVMPEGAVIKIDQVRKLNAFAVQTPQISKYKVAVIVDAHLLNTNAANTLLKTLEEPPLNTHILISTPHWGRLLPTLRSRCQRYQVQQNLDIGTAWLIANGMEISDQDFAQSGYAPLKMLDQERFNLNTWLTELESNTDPMTSVASLLDSDILDALARWYRDLIWQQKESTNRTLLAFAEEVNRTRLQLETSNSANAKLLAERLVYLWLQVVRLRQRRNN